MDKGNKVKESIPISIDDILYVESFDDDVFVVTNTDSYKIKARLYEFEQTYQFKGFIRINKSYVVNILKVKHIYPLFNSKLKLILSNQSALYVTRTYLKTFKHYLKSGGEHIDH